MGVSRKGRMKPLRSSAMIATCPESVQIVLSPEEAFSQDFSPADKDCAKLPTVGVSIEGARFIKNVDLLSRIIIMYIAHVPMAIVNTVSI